MCGFELYISYYSEDEMLSNCDGAIFFRTQWRTFYEATPRNFIGQKFI